MIEVSKGKDKPNYKDPNVELLFEMAKNAWSLSSDQIDSIKPGEEGLSNVYDLLNIPLPADRPCLPKTKFDFDNPHIHILRLMRQPEFFPFTCKNLLCRPDGGGPLVILPFQQIALQELWSRQFPMLIMTRGGSKSFLLGLYALLRALFTPGSKIVITGAAFRQSKAVFEYIERIWWNSPVLRSLINSSRSFKRGIEGRQNGPRRDIDRVEFIVGDSVITGIPIGSGEKVRGLRANYILGDEIASLSEHVYSVVVQGFASVTADPIGNVKDLARIKLLKRLGLWTDEMNQQELEKSRGNQSVLSGTASYSFNHFYKYWKDYKNIIESGGDKQKLEKIFNGVIPDGFRWKSYSIIRLPYELIPKGFMDEETIIRAKRITSTSEYNLEYGAVWVKDSDGFFRRSLIESCVVGRPDVDPLTFPSSGPVQFTASLRGNKKCKYIYGIDPASENDKFALVIIEDWGDHRRIIYCWTTTKSQQKSQLKKKMTTDHNFYLYAVRKIRSLFKEFPPTRILVDKGGGGVSIREAFGDPDKLESGEKPIYEVIDPDLSKRKDTDGMPGEHILEVVNFNTEWLMESNEGLKKDMEDHIVLFPLLDSLALGMAEMADEVSKRISINEDGEKVFTTQDTLEQNMLEIEKLKDELASIVVTQTPTGKRHWDTPDHKQPGSKVGRMRKDRYSALLLANMGARQLARNYEFVYEGVTGGFISDLAQVGVKRTKTGQLYKGPAWFTEKMCGSGYYGAVARKD